LRTLHEQTGHRVVVLVDEYDNFILHALGDEAKVALARQRFQNLFGPLKAEDDHLQFAFITGISKFSQMGIFSKLNNLYNISMVPAYEELCGISEAELTMQLRPDIEQLAQQNGLSFDEQLQELKRMYDGYHFCERLTDIYNPFSLIKAFYSGQVKKYWFESGTSAALIAMLQQMPPLELQDVDGAVCESDAFDESFDSYQAPLPVLYQSGYLTIKDYSREDDTYTLGFPNQEVRTGFASSLYRAVTNTMSDDHGRTAMMRAYKNFKRDDALPPFIEAIKTFYAGVPYQWERDNRNEHYYHAMLYTLLTAFGADLRAEEATAKGRSDITLLMPRGIYVMELKYDDTAQAALAQIAAKGYAEKYRQDGRPVVMVGISFSSKEHNIDDWLAQRL